MKKWIACFVFLMSLACVQAQNMDCRVRAVMTGDTFTCENDAKRTITVKLYQAEAPKLTQNFGREAKEALALVLGDRVRLDVHDTSQADYVVATVYTSLMCSCFPTNHPKAHMNAYMDCLCWQDVTKTMIEQGNVWRSIFSQSNPEYIQAEQMARKNKLGLWRQEHPIAPWLWSDENH